MANIVKHLLTGKNYILIGTGFAAYKTANHTHFIANRISKPEEGEITMVAVCDENGHLSWLNSDEIEIVEIDGNLPQNILSHK